ncbi:MAG: SusC/RagA family TonB-linked outer membrane protein [bacterium]
MRCVRTAVMLSALFLLALGVGRASAQTATGVVTGRVMDSTTSKPIVGARISIVGSSRATGSRDDGSYVLPGVPVGARRVRLNVLGYRAQEIPVTVSVSQTAIANFSVTRAAIALSEIVTVGYGTQRRSDLTGSISSVSAEDVLKNSPQSLEQGLQGRVAGVQVTQGDAAPGGAITVNIRGISTTSGSAQPLYVIDGVPVGSDGFSKMTLGGTEPSFTTLTTVNPLSQIAPSDIESIDILKDASATAIYGSRASNGVVIITTRRGQNGQGQFALSYSSGMSKVVREVNVLNALDYATYANVATKNAGRTDCPYGCGTNTGGTPSLTPEQLASQFGSGINWQDRIFHDAPTRDLQMAFSGGDNIGGFAISTNYYDQSGAIIGSGFKRGGVRMNVDRQLNSILHVTSNLSGTRSTSNLVRTSGTEGTTAQGIIRSAIRYSPLPSEAIDSARAIADPRAENQSYFSRYGANPTRYTDQVNETEAINRGLGSVRLSAALPRGLSFESSIGGNFEQRDNDSYFPRTVAEGNSNGGLALVSGAEYRNLVHEDLLKYNVDINANNRIDAVGGFTYEWNQSNYLKNQVSSFPDDALGSNRLQNGLASTIPQTGIDIWKLASWLGRANYSLNDKYLLTGTVRRDGSSRFAINNKWATFSSLGAAWRMNKESFFAKYKALDELKLRASVGQTGNQAINPYQSLATINGLTTVIGENLVAAAEIGRLANPNLHWETTLQKDAGLDASFFGSRLSFTVDVYDKNTTDLLQTVNLATNTGYSQATFNSGSVSNKGIELSAQYELLRGRGGGLQWIVSGNYSRNRNKITDLGNTQQQFSDRLGAGGGLEVNPFIQKPGYPIGTIWGYKTDGIFHNQAEVDAYKKVQSDARIGDYRFANVNGDTTLSDDDRTQIGDVNPRYTWGITNRFRVGKFDLSALVTASQGNSIINSSRLTFLVLNGNDGNIPYEYYQNAFDPTTNPNGKYPMIRSDRAVVGRFSDAFVEDGSYVRLKNVQLGYEISPNLVPGVATARVFVNGINLWTHTKYTGFDPEVSAFSDASMRGVDLGSYPQARTFTLGLSVTF